MGISLSLFVCYLVPLYLWSEQIKVANEIQTNFRDSVRQIYEGDTLSVKESFEMPKHIEYVYCADVSNERVGYKNIAPLMHSDSFKAISQNTKGSIKCNQYPSVIMLKKSSLNSNEDVSEQNMAENLDQKGSDGLNCMNSQFLHMYN